jgi:hypothetical protein
LIFRSISARTGLPTPGGCGNLYFYSVAVQTIGPGRFFLIQAQVPPPLNR